MRANAPDEVQELLQEFADKSQN